ncbi:hypothetical protein VNO77_27710 [Canavalia gladiata]|uniref:Uncharacterized protein n=1 Tax=Canavalia gladiata TaxID=3824 RepID=A0AAN9Q7B0_CANGL
MAPNAMDHAGGAFIGSLTIMGWEESSFADEGCFNHCFPAWNLDLGYRYLSRKAATSVKPERPDLSKMLNSFPRVRLFPGHATLHHSHLHVPT